MAKFEQIESKFLRTFAKSADIDKGKSREVPPKIKEAGVWLNIELTKFFFLFAEFAKLGKCHLLTHLSRYLIGSER